MTTKTLTSLLIGVLLAAAACAYADDSRIQVAMEGGKTRAQFTVGDSRCVLVDDQVRCTRIAK
jgi:hypothetical protein